IGANGATLRLQNSSGETKIPSGSGAWRKGRAYFIASPDNRMSVTGEQPVAASGAWITEDTYAMKLCFYQTPFSVTLTFQFKGDQLLFDTEYNVAFGPVKLPQLVGITP
ncbi:MAG: hypothetical protein U0V70_17445, partial [Terriglobia bacterium]